MLNIVESHCCKFTAVFWTHLTNFAGAQQIWIVIPSQLDQENQVRSYPEGLVWYEGKTMINHPPVITSGMFTIPSHGWYIIVLPTLHSN